MDFTYVALAKGELGKEIENYLSGYGVDVQLDGRPLNFVQRADGCIFRPMWSKDVPWYVSERAAYGITGEDVATNYQLGKGAGIKVVDKLGFGKGDLVVFTQMGRQLRKGRRRLSTGISR